MGVEDGTSWVGERLDVKCQVFEYFEKKRVISFPYSTDYRICALPRFLFACYVEATRIYICIFFKKIKADDIPGYE